MIREDKIMNNKFSSGELSFEEFRGDIKIDNRVADLYEDQIGDLIEYRTLKNIHEDIHKFFIESEFYEKYKKPKRVDKKDMIKMYYYFRDKIGKDNYGAMDFFVGFCEFFQINYKQLHNEITVLDKEKLLRDVVDRYGMENRIKTKRLF